MTTRTARLSGLACALLGASLILVGCGSEKKAGDADGSVPSTPAAAVEGKPRIVALAADHNFGKVKQGATVEHTFKIKNEGTADLKIEKARGS